MSRSSRNRSGSLCDGDGKPVSRRRLGGELPIALAAVAEMAAHGGTRAAAPCARGSRLKIARCSSWIICEIGALALGAAGRLDAHALARNDEAAEIFEESDELRIAGGLGDGAMKGEILVDRRLAARDRRVDRPSARSPIARSLRRRCALGREARRLDLDRHAQLHHVQHLADRAQPVGVDAERPALHSLATKAPTPWRVTTSPSARSAATASRTTVRLTPIAPSSPARSADARRGRACRRQSRPTGARPASRVRLRGGGSGRSARACQWACLINASLPYNSRRTGNRDESFLSPAQAGIHTSTIGSWHGSDAGASAGALTAQRADGSVRRQLQRSDRDAVPAGRERGRSWLRYSRARKLKSVERATGGSDEAS